MLAHEPPERPGGLVPFSLGRQRPLAACGELTAPADREDLRVTARHAPEAVSPVALRAPSETASEDEEAVDPFKELFNDELMCMSYLYSK